jgi:hypothetical protein
MRIPYSSFPILSLGVWRASTNVCPSKVSSISSFNDFFRPLLTTTGFRQEQLSGFRLQQRNNIGNAQRVGCYSSTASIEEYAASSHQKGHPHHKCLHCLSRLREYPQARSAAHNVINGPVCCAVLIQQVMADETYITMQPVGLPRRKLMTNENRERGKGGTQSPDTATVMSKCGNKHRGQLDR